MIALGIVLSALAYLLVGTVLIGLERRFRAFTVREDDGDYPWPLFIAFWPVLLFVVIPAWCLIVGLWWTFDKVSGK